MSEPEIGLWSLNFFQSCTFIYIIDLNHNSDKNGYEVAY